MSKKKKNTNEPIAKAEDVEYSRELADENDVEAQARAKEADERARAKDRNI